MARDGPGDMCWQRDMMIMIYICLILYICVCVRVRVHSIVYINIYIYIFNFGFCWNSLRCRLEVRIDEILIFVIWGTFFRLLFVVSRICFLILLHIYLLYLCCSEGPIYIYIYIYV